MMKLLNQASEGVLFLVTTSRRSGAEGGKEALIRVRGSPSRNRLLFAALFILVGTMIVITLVLGPSLLEMFLEQRRYDMSLPVYTFAMTGLMFLTAGIAAMSLKYRNMIVFSSDNFKIAGASFSYDYISEANIDPITGRLVLTTKVPVGGYWKKSRYEISKDRVEPSFKILLDFLSQRRIRLDGTKAVFVEPSGRLLYAEPHSTFVRRKYETAALISMVAVFFLSVSVYGLVDLALHGRETTDELINAILGLALLVAFSVFLLVIEVLGMKDIQRFEIYDDRIALPYPQKRTFRKRKPETILKNDLSHAYLDYTVKGGAFKRKISGMDDYGLRGEWRCILTFKNGETFILTHQRVNVTGDCIPALKEFVRGIEE